MARKIHSEEIHLDIVIGGSKGQAQLSKLEQEAREVNQQIKLLNKEISKSKDKDSEAHQAMVANRRELGEQLRANKMQQATLRRELGLSGLTYKQLGQEAKRVSMQLSNATYGTEQWKKLNAELIRIKARMSEVRGGAEHTGMSLGNMANGFNKYFLMVSTFVMSLTGLVAGIRKAYMAFADFDDKLADVMKTTGLSKEQVKELNQHLEKIDTRSSQEDLLNLARIAGKLGINASEDVLQFVNAADKINVALSEDLGGDAEEAIRQLGKIVDIFKLKDQFGMEQSLLKVGSAINSLGAASTANEPYLVEFSKRMAGVAPSVGITIQNVLGLAATLDQLGQTSEVSSTVISQILPKMFKDTATFAGIARMSLADFTELLNTDANEALLRVLGGLKGNEQGFSQLVASLGDIGLEGKRTISVLGVLANNTNLVRSQQAYANQEFEKGTSILEEFNVKNNTARASLDKAIKSIQKTWRELGEKLQPALSHVISKGTALVRSLSSVVDFFIRYGVVIRSTLAALASFIITTKAYGLAVAAATRAKAIWSTVVQLFSGKINVASRAMQFFNTVSKANVIGAVVGLIMGLVTALSMLKPRYDEAASSQKALNDISKEGNKKLLEEKQQVETLLKIARDEARSKEERLSAIRRLNAISPEYLGNLKFETIQTDQATQATKKYIEVLNLKYKVQAAEEKVVDLNRQLLDMEIGKGDVAIGGWQKAWNLIKAGGNFTTAQIYNLNNEATKLGVTYQDVTRQIETLNEFILRNKQLGVKPATQQPEEEEDNLPAPGADLSEELKQKQEQLERESEKILQAYQTLYDELSLVELTEHEKSTRLLEREYAKRKALLDEALAKGIISQAEFQESLRLLDTDRIARQAELDQKELQRIQGLDAEKLQNEKQHQEQVFQLRQQYGLVEWQELLQRELALLEEQLSQKLLSEAQYQQARRSILDKYARVDAPDEKKLAGEDALENLNSWAETQMAATEAAYRNNEIGFELHQKRLSAIQQQYEESRNQVLSQALDASLQIYGNMFGSLAAFFEQGSDEYKMFASFQVALDTISAAMAAYKATAGIPVVGPALAPIAAATAAGFGLQKIVEINSTQVPQYFYGNYEVLGEQTGRRYQARYRGKPKTGLVQSPSLFLAGDDPYRLSEMIISGPDLQHPVIADYARAILNIKANRDPGFMPAQEPSPGLRHMATAPSAPQSVQTPVAGSDEALMVLHTIAELLRQPTRARVVYSDLELAQHKMEQIRKDVARG